MGFGIGESKSSTKINSTVEKSPITADNGGLALRGSSAAFDNSAVSGTQVKLGRNARLTINQAPPDAKLFENFIGSQNATLEQYLNGSAEALKDRDKTLADVLSAVTDLAANQQTGGESGRDKTILYVVLAGLAAVAVIFGKRSVIYVGAAGAAAWFIFGKGK